MAARIRAVQAVMQLMTATRKRRRDLATRTREQQVAWRGAPTSGAQRHTDTREERDQIWWYALTHLTCTVLYYLCFTKKVTQVER